MDLGQQAAFPLLPVWLQRVAERAPAQMPEHISSIRREECQVHEVNGFKVLKCQEILEVFRCSADGQKEIVEKTESTSTRPYEQPSAVSSSGRYDGVMEGPMGPVVSATLGQMLDDFFQYAAELQESLEQQDASRTSSWAPWGRGSNGGGSSSGSSAEESSRLSSWWRRRKPPTALAAADAGLSQPSLQQLVRESSSDVQEI